MKNVGFKIVSYSIRIFAIFLIIISGFGIFEDSASAMDDIVYLLLFMSGLILAIGNEIIVLLNGIMDGWDNV